MVINSHLIGQSHQRHYEILLWGRSPDNILRSLRTHWAGHLKKAKTSTTFSHSLGKKVYVTGQGSESDP